MRTANDIIHDILIQNKKEIELSKTEVCKLFDTEDEIEIRSIIQELITLQPGPSYSRK